MAKCKGRGLVVKRPGALSKVQKLNLVLGVGVFSLLPNLGNGPLRVEIGSARRGELLIKAHGLFLGPPPSIQWGKRPLHFGVNEFLLGSLLSHF